MTLVLAYQSIFRSHFEDISFSRAISRLSVGATAKFAASGNSHSIKHEWCHQKKDNKMIKGPKVDDTQLAITIRGSPVQYLHESLNADCLFTVCSVTRHTVFTATGLISC